MMSTEHEGIKQRFNQAHRRIIDLQLALSLPTVEQDDGGTVRLEAASKDVEKKTLPLRIGGIVTGLPDDSGMRMSEYWWLEKDDSDDLIPHGTRFRHHGSNPFARWEETDVVELPMDGERVFHVKSVLEGIEAALERLPNHTFTPASAS